MEVLKCGPCVIPNVQTNGPHRLCYNFMKQSWLKIKYLFLSYLLKYVPT